MVWDDHGETTGDRGLCGDAADRGGFLRRGVEGLSQAAARFSPGYQGDHHGAAE